MEKIFERYFEILLKCFEYDITVYSTNMWMYWWACIPAFAYTVFFFVKWTVLTTPIWMPLSMILRGLPVIVKTIRNAKTS